MKKMNGFEFERGIDDVRNLNRIQITALIERLVERNFTPAMAQHIKEGFAEVNDPRKLEGIANELLVIDAEKQTEPLFVIYHENTPGEKADDSLQERFLKAIENSIITEVQKSRSTMGGSRTPITHAPTIRYKQIGSTSRPGHVHTVTLTGGVPTSCTCEGFYHRQTCKHLRMA